MREDLGERFRVPVHQGPLLAESEGGKRKDAARVGLGSGEGAPPVVSLGEAADGEAVRVEEGQAVKGNRDVLYFLIANHMIEKGVTV